MDRWTDRLSDYVDDELDGPERNALEQHLLQCEACRRALDEIRRVTARAARLPLRAPERDLWPGIEHRIRAIRPARRTITLSLPQLAAAAVLLVALSGGLIWTLRGPARVAETARDGSPVSGTEHPSARVPVSLADQTYDRAVADLQRTLDERRGRLDPNTIEIVEKNLRVIDGAIAQAQRALAADPSNVYLNGHLADARRRKLALLRSVSLLSDPEG